MRMLNYNMNLEKSCPAGADRPYDLLDISLWLFTKKTRNY